MQGKGMCLYFFYEFYKILFGKYFLVYCKVGNLDEFNLYYNSQMKIIFQKKVIVIERLGIKIWEKSMLKFLRITYVNRVIFGLEE